MPACNLVPRQPFPLAERKLTPPQIALDRLAATNCNRRVIRARKIAADRTFEPFVGKRTRKGLRLRAALGIEWNVHLPLKPPVAIPIGRAVAYESQPDITLRRE
jgi:hypothetical protein